MNMCLSGGALGADSYWGELALKNGHKLKHYIFQDYNYTGDTKHTVILL